MSEYKVEITRPAERDIAEIYLYIAEELKEPQAAKRIFSSIKKEIMSLSAVPERHRIIDGREYLESGLRKISVENYAVFYTIAEPGKAVYILRVLYMRREWQALFSADNV